MHRRKIMMLAATVAVLVSGCGEFEIPDVTLPSAPSSAGATAFPTPGPGPSGQAATPAPTPVPTAGDAASVLAAIPVRGRAPQTGYDRDEFGQSWADIDHNGCDQRNDALARALTEVVLREGSTCVVASGTLLDPYTGGVIPFTRGETTSDDVQIDHVVALSNAWQTGAQQLSEAARETLANDPLNLQAVEGRINQSKSDSDAATWLPPDRNFWCPYVARQVAVKAKYGLWVTAGEADAINRVLSGCPGQPLPSDSGIPVPTA